MRDELQLKVFENRVFYFVIIIWFISILYRLYFYDNSMPVLMDSLNFFSYATDTHVLGNLPENYTVAKPGWSILLAGLFSIFNFENTQSYMQLQSITSLIVSTLVIFPLYFLSKIFFERKYSLIVISFFALEPHLIQNSLLGTTEPLYLLCLVTSLFLFLSNNNKMIYVSFIVAGIATIVRPEGIFLFIAMSAMLIFRFRKERRSIMKYFLAIFLFVIVLIPITIHNEDVDPGSSVFNRVLSTLDLLYTSQNNLELSPDEQVINEAPEFSFTAGLMNFSKFLGWAMIPMFIISLPIGFVLFFRGLSYDKLTLIVVTIITAIPAFYVYSYLPNLDIRYLYLLFPLFCIFSVLPIKLFFERIKNENKIIIVPILIIIFSSMIFYNYELDSQHDKEALLIAQRIVDSTTMVNTYYPESIFIKSLDLPEEWLDFKNFYKNSERTKGDLLEDLPHKIKGINPDKFDTLESFIVTYDKQFSHIITDSMENRPEFLKDVFQHEDKYPYLIKEWDSSDEDYKYHVKIFRIDYELFNSEIEK